MLAAGWPANWIKRIERAHCRLHRATTGTLTGGCAAGRWPRYRRNRPNRNEGCGIELAVGMRIGIGIGIKIGVKIGIRMRAGEDEGQSVSQVGGMRWLERGGTCVSERRAASKTMPPQSAPAETMAPPSSRRRSEPLGAARLHANEGALWWPGSGGRGQLTQGARARSFRGQTSELLALRARNSGKSRSERAR